MQMFSKYVVSSFPVLFSADFIDVIYLFFSLPEPIVFPANSSHHAIPASNTFLHMLL
jgi:hypothetical protein